MRSGPTVLAGIALLGSTLVATSPASAAGDYDPNVTRVANPANVCKSIPGTVGFAAGMFGVEIDTSDFDYAGCVRTMARGDAFIPGFGDPYAQCDALVGMGFVSYPAVLHAEEGDPFPDLKVNNRKQCGNALYAFHEIETALLPYLPPGPA